jgi:antitoxin ParD1/3/4
VKKQGKSGPGKKALNHMQSFVTLSLSTIFENLQVVYICCIFAPNKYIMARQSISFTKPNEEWLKEQVNNEEYTSKSELINDLIRQARKQQVQVDFIRAKLDKAESSGFTDDAKEQILKQSKSLLNGQI